MDVAVNIYGVDMGDGLFGQEDLKTHFSIGDAVISTVDDDTKTVTVTPQRRGGQGRCPLDGQEQHATNNGVYIVGGRFSHIIMDSSTYGVPVNSPNGYRTEVDWATQISYSGIFVHSAPWSVGAQGNTNTSHGCFNVSPSNGDWFYKNTKRGDIVEIVKRSAVDIVGDGGTWRLEHSVGTVEGR